MRSLTTTQAGGLLFRTGMLPAANSLRKAQLTGKGKSVIELLTKKYFMTEPAAIQLVRDGGPMLGTALVLLARKHNYN